MEKHAAYHKISFVEMLEMVGRAADVWAEQCMEAGASTLRKIEGFLDDLMENFGKTRIPVQLDCESESCSDEDY